MKEAPTATPDDPATMAKRAGLVYVTDEQPGYSRRGCGTGFTYLTPGGDRLADGAEVQRCKDLVIPPAWQKVWICTQPDGHLQATGYDDAGRKQYRYHEEWSEARNLAKFDRMRDFAKALPAIRERVTADLRRRKLSREKVLAVVVELLQTTLIRVGNDSYAKANNTFGLTTMRRKHIELVVPQSDIRFRRQES